MAENIRGTHVSPGIYSKETDITYAVKNLGITSLGLVGETLRGPAFQPIEVENWREYQTIFGGTSAEKFKGSQYPKYELPYIAKSYLSESNRLQVCRVLGLSGYNAGPAWVLTVEAEGSNEKMVVAVLRSRGHYEKYQKYAVSGTCSCPAEKYDALVFDVGEIMNDKEYDCNQPKKYNMNAIALGEYTSFSSNMNDCGESENNSDKIGFSVNSINKGKFKIYGYRGAISNSVNVSEEVNDKDERYFEYSVTLNPSDKDYILKVLGTNPFDTKAPLYVEALYDVALNEFINKHDNVKISKVFETYNVHNVADYCLLDPVNGIMTLEEKALSRKYVGTRWLADKNAENKKIICHKFDFVTNKVIESENKETVIAGHIYTVRQVTDENGKRYYYYGYYDESESNLPENLSLVDLIKAVDVVQDEFVYTNDGTKEVTVLLNDEYYVMNQILHIRKDLITENNTTVLDGGKIANISTSYRSAIVKNNSDNLYYRYVGEGDVMPVTCELNNYKDTYRYASTPWFVSNLKGDATHYEMNKLFRFHTISDGNVSNQEVKVSIQNIKPDNGTFDVVIRDVNDSDESINVLEKYINCTLTPGDNGYIAYKIGSFDGVYETKSKYVTVEVNENLIPDNSVPAGFLGYPLGNFNGVQIAGDDKHDNISSPELLYNTSYNDDVKDKRQYFGLSTSVGVDIDSFTYKGKMSYTEKPEFICPSFHLDARLDSKLYEIEGNTMPKITVDGEVGYKFISVPRATTTKFLQGTPIIASEVDMLGSIYENVSVRKFTAYFYGGFDGWDIYRDARTNTDEFKMNKYQGDYNTSNGEGYSFDKIIDAYALGLNQQGITSDWYAYLAGVRQFANPEEVDINVFATPGIDIVNNTSLVEEVIEMIEEERADSIYVVTTPDKPYGATDYIDDMYTAEDIVYELEDTEIDSNYTCTYYPWVKYHDKDNNKYIYLPATKDVVRNMALTDNTAYPWFSPAGISRGDVNCVRAHYVTKLADEDVLYNGRINPIKTFASDGVKVWGQKNLQIKESLLNRIAVRRLLLRLRKMISIACIGLIFEPNDASTKGKFLSIVTPILDNIRSNRGISDYRLEVDDSIEARDRRELPCKIYIKPYNALEYITLDFIVTPEGVSFDSI